MGRPGLTTHRKFRRLVRALGNAAIARGSLELLWDQVYEPGDAYLGNAEDLEHTAAWAGERGFLTRALLEAGGEGQSGFIDEVEGRPSHYEIHDLHDHCPDYVRRRMAREAIRKSRGLTLRDQRVAAGLASGEARRQAGTSSEHLANRCSTYGATPTPTPTPTPKEELLMISAPLAPAPLAPLKPKKKIIRTTELKGDSTEWFSEIWAITPKNVSRWDQVQRRDLSIPVPKGSRLEAERAFQRIVDEGIASARTLYVAWFLYLQKGEGPKAGFIQRPSTFFGTTKGTFTEWIDEARELEAREYAEEVPA